MVLDITWFRIFTGRSQSFVGLASHEVSGSGTVRWLNRHRSCFSRNPVDLSLVRLSAVDASHDDRRWQCSTCFCIAIFHAEYAGHVVCLDSYVAVSKF